jgi:Flp pilus assembly protein TadD
MFRADNYAAAERLAREALAADPNAAAAHTLLSRALTSLGRAKAGLAASEAALALHPDGPAFYAQATALRALRRRREAAAAAQEAARLSPQRADYANLLGILQEEAGRWNEARASLEHAVSLAPANDEIRASCGLFLLRRRKVAEAERLAQDLAPTSDGTLALLLRGRLAILRHRPAEAKDFALWVLSRNATDRGALRLLVEAKAGQSRLLRLWWYYQIFLNSAPRQAVPIVACAMLLGLLVPGLNILVIGFAYYSLAARRTFRMWLKRELKALDEVRLSKRF